MIRNAARRAVSAALRLVPAPWADSVRHQLVRSTPGTLSHRTLRAMTYVLRYRGVPRRLESFALLDNPRVRLANTDSFIVEWLYWFGERYGYEPAEIAWWKVFVSHATGILDLGANVGYYAVQAGAGGHDVPYTAVEPHPGSAGALRENLALNGIDHVVVVESAAVPQPPDGPVELRLPVTRDHYAEAPTGAFVDADGTLPDIGLGRFRFHTVEVEGVELRTLLTPRTDLIKIDVEGQEHLLLTAIEDHLASVRPTIFLEMLDGADELRAWVRDVLLPLGYHCYVPRSDVLEEVDGATLVGSSVDSRHRSRDVVLTCLDVSAWRLATPSSHEVMSR